MQSAEDAYLFRHAVVRDAAYELQPPSVRAQLHELVIEVVLGLHGGRAPSSMAAELADHAGSAIQFGATGQRIRKLRAQLLATALQHTTAGFQLHESISLALQLAALEWIRDDQRTDALLTAAEFCDRTGQRSRGEEITRQILDDEFIKLSKRQLERALVLRSVIQIHQGDYPAAEKTLTSIVEMAPDEMGPISHAVALGNLAIVHHELGQVGLAEQGYRRAIAAFRELGEVEGVGRNLGNLGNLLRDQGKWDEAETALREGLALVREAGDRMTEGIILGNLAEQLRVQKRFKDARDVIAEAQVIQRRMGDDEGLAKSTSNLAEVYACEGKLDRGIELAREAVAQLEVLENPLLEAGARRRLAEHLFENDRLDEAEVEAAAAAETLKRIGAQELLCGSVLPLEVRIAVKRGVDASKKTALLDRLDEAEAVLRKLGLSNESGGIRRIDNSRDLLRGEV